MKRVARGEERTQGLRCGACGSCAWKQVCAEEWARTSSVSLVYGATGAVARKLVASGFATWPEVATSTAAALARRTGLSPDRAESLWLHARARAEGRPQARGPASSPVIVPVIYYDIESCDGAVYLHGAIRTFKGEREERQFVARRPEEEGRAWRELLEWLSRDGEAVIYSWSNYERIAMHSLRERHGGSDAGWKLLVTSLVDQCALVRRRWALPVSGYGIKEVAPLFGFNWNAEDAGGLNSEAWYREWLTNGDEAKLEKILQYNLDDVRAMEVVDRALK